MARTCPGVAYTLLLWVSVRK